MVGENKMNKTQLLERFEDMLPASLGEPYIMNTVEKPYVFVAFYDAREHEMKDGTTINGCEFRLWKPSLGINGSKSMAGIIGFDTKTFAPTVLALTDSLTKSKDLKPYSRMLVEMMAQISQTQNNC
jgi:hypothetical protein